MTLKFGRQILLTPVALALLGAFALQVRQVRDAGHAQVASDLADLQQSDAALRQAMADAQAAPLANYDVLAAAQQRMTLTAGRLPGDFGRLYSGRPAQEIVPARQACQDAIAQELTRAEDFKSRHALLQAEGTAPDSLEDSSPAPDDSQVGLSLTALADACAAENTRERLAALLCGLGFTAVSAFLFGGFPKAAPVNPSHPVTPPALAGEGRTANKGY